MKIALAGDHAGYDFKEQVIQFLDSQEKWEFKNYGTNSTESCDYPDYIHPAAQSLESGENDFAIFICGSGNGVCMTANKYAHVRAALCWNEELAELARLHNDANAICIPARFVSIETAINMIKTFLETDFEGGRHQRRVDKISK